MFSHLIKKNQHLHIFLGSPEAEAESNDNARIPLIDVYEDFHGLLEGLSHEKFIVTGRKGSGKSALGEYVYIQSLGEPNSFCRFIRKSEFDLETVVQLGESVGIPVDRDSLFRWIIYTNILEMLVKNPAIENNKDYSLLQQFLRKNSGYIKINEFEIKQLIEKQGLSVNTENFARFFRTKFSKDIEIKSERAPYYKLLPHLEELIIILLESEDNIINKNSYALFFDDLDVGFSTENPSSVDSVMSLIRTCRYINNEVFGKRNLKAKAIILLRDDIEAYLATRYADSAKIFSSYTARIDWYQEAYASSQQDENELNLKKFINKRISYAFKKAKLQFNSADPWSSLVNYSDKTNTDKSSFKYVVSQTLFRPRDLLLFFLPLDSGQYPIPLNYNDISILANHYAEELAREIKNELSSFYTQIQIETIFKALGEISKSNSRSFEGAISLIRDNCKDLNEKSVLEFLFDRSIIGMVDQKNWYTFKCRISSTRSPLISLDDSQAIVVQHGIKKYLANKGYR